MIIDNLIGLIKGNKDKYSMEQLQEMQQLQLDAIIQQINKQINLLETMVNELE